ncbi:MAG: glutamine-hydrolyzing GMP synthase [Chloroflexota bacterium]|nr:MAG: glutamine-hydrolyzing GMP synthase [Chloroflexota bacterium]
MTGHQAVAILDFGSQYSQLIARRVRELGVYAELVAPGDEAAIARIDPIAFIFSGSPYSVYEDGAPLPTEAVYASGKPVLAICYGMQLLADRFGGKVSPAVRREFGQANINVHDHHPLFADLPTRLSVWMSHGDHVESIPPDFSPIARSDNGSPAAMARGQTIAIQFHPEVVHTPDGGQILRNFLFGIAGARGDWTAASAIDDAIASIQRAVGGGRAIVGLSGGVDSAVAAALTARAIGDRLTCVFVDHGLLRKDEAEEVEATFRDALGLNLVVARAADRFLDQLRGVTEPEEKRRRIGREFVRVFEYQAARMTGTSGQFDFLVQGTLYPDVIESAGTGRAQTIKTHHNVGGLPEQMEFDIVEPLRMLFKDEVRRIGLALGLPERLVWRHPFPGPGLAIRILGEVTKERLDTLREADAIFLRELETAGLYRSCAQALAVLTPIRTVGVMGDARTYANVVALRAVTTDDFMTADWARLPYDLLARVSSRIVNEVPGVNRVVYDISSKPPATIEWE